MFDPVSLPGTDIYGLASDIRQSIVEAHPLAKAFVSLDGNAGSLLLQYDFRSL